MSRRFGIRIPDVTRPDRRGLMADRLLRFGDLNVTSDGGYFLDPVTPQVIGGFGANAIPQGVISGRNYAGIFASYKNDVPYSQQINQANWTKSRVTVTANQADAPDGTTTADKLADTAVNNTHTVIDKTTGAAATWTLAALLKNVDRRYANYRIYKTTNDWVTITVDLQTGAITQSAKGSATAALAVTGLTDFGNGWYLLDVTATLASGQVYYSHGMSNTGTPSLDTNGDSSYLGDGSSFYAWQAQLVANAYSVCSILSEAAVVTRAADVCYWSSADVPAAILSGTYAINLVNFWAHTEPGGNLYLLAIDANNYLRWNNTAKTFELYAGGVKKMDSNALTLSRYRSALGLTCNLGTGNMTVAGADSGDGTNSGASCSWSAGNLYFGCDHASGNHFDGLISEPYRPR